MVVGRLHLVGRALAGLLAGDDMRHVDLLGRHGFERALQLGTLGGAWSIRENGLVDGQREGRGEVQHAGAKHSLSQQAARRA